MANIDAPEGFAFILDESADEIALRIEDHREDPLFEGRVVDESRKICRALLALGLDPVAAEIDRSSGGAAIVQGEAAAYTVRHMTLRWPRRGSRRRTIPRSPSSATPCPRRRARSGAVLSATGP